MRALPGIGVVVLLAAGLLTAGTPRVAAGVPAGCATAALCEGFENQSGVPAGRWQVSFPDCRGTGTAVIDSAVAHAGTRSVRIDGGGGYCNHVFVGTPLAGLVTGTQLYVRFWVRHATALPPAHVTFLAMNDAADANRDLRAGGQNQALQWNRESDDATLPEQSPAGVAMSHPLPTAAWTCVEFHLDEAAGRIETWVDDQAVAGLIEDGVPTHDVDSQWLRRTGWQPRPTDLRIGWESYGGETDTLWFDDLAVDAVRTGCAG